MESNSPHAGAPPPKPWERAGGSSGPAPFKPPSSGSTSDVVEASGTAKPGEVVPTFNRNVTTTNTTLTRPVPARTWQNYGANYGGYGSSICNSSYGSNMHNSYRRLGSYGSLYGNNMYSSHGGLYGGSGMYGGGVYNSDFGSPMGGFGMSNGGPYGNQDPNNPFGPPPSPPSPPGFWTSFLRLMQGAVSCFARIAMLMDQNTQAFHLLMTALFQLKELIQDYKVLSDPEKREIYDQHGEDALNEGMEDGSGGGGSSRGLRQRRGEDLIYPFNVSLEDLYNGTSKKLSVSVNVICQKCSGKRSESGASTIQQTQHPCNPCEGTGETINEKDPCPECKGEKVVLEKKVLEVVVEKGMQTGQKVTFPGEADEAPESVTGDIVFILQLMEHAKFKRKGNDLFYKHTLSLTEALCGFEFALTHLDNRQLLIKSNPGEVVKADQFKVINDEGMPKYQRPLMKGKLYIHFSVDFPDSLTLEQCKALEAGLPPRPRSQITETTLHDVDIEEEM